MAFEYESDSVYCELVKLVLNSEGGYVNNPKDPGGPTKYGIAVNYNRGILDSLGVKDVRNLTYEQAKQIYYRKYYLACGADLLAKRSVKLAYLHFDSAVNHGVGRSSLFLRMCSGFEKFNAVAGGPGVNVDFWNDQFYDYLAARLQFYTQIKTWSTFGKGWINRIAGILRHVDEMPS